MLALKPSPSLAEVTGFFVWQPERGGNRYLLPKVSGQDPQSLTRRLIQAIKSSSTYGSMQNAQKIHLSTSPETFFDVPTSSPEHPNIAVLLNRPSQMTHLNQALSTVVKSFEPEGLNLLAVPVGLELVLSDAEMSQFRAQLSNLDGQLGLGGDDVHPLAYGKSDTSRTQGDISLERDVEIMKYMREYMETGKGRVFYICGSMQRAAVLAGHAFHDDIEHLTQIKHRGENGPILLEVVADPESELAIAAGTTRFKTSNYHHAAVDPALQDTTPKDAPTISSFNVEPDGSVGKIVKSVEFMLNRGMGTQFHPEFRGSPEEARILRYLAAGWKLGGRRPPDEISDYLEKLTRKLKGICGVRRE